MSIWNDKWCIVVHIHQGMIEGSRYYFPTKEEAEKFRLSIVKEKDVEACYLVKGEDIQH